MACHVRLAIALDSVGRHDRAIAEWRESVRLTPIVWSVRIGLADALLAHGDASEAAAQCREVLSQQPGEIEAIVDSGCGLGRRRQCRGSTSPIEAGFGARSAQRPSPLLAGRSLAGPRAVTKCRRASQRGDSPGARRCVDVVANRLDSGDKSRSLNSRWTAGDRVGQECDRAFHRPRAGAFDALAAALAETGEFSAAVDAAEHASTIALLRNDDALVDALGQRTRLYRQGMPYRQPASPVPAGHAPPETAE